MKRGVKLATKIQATPILLSADPVRITQAVGNILYNALKFTQPTGTVLVTLKTQKDKAVISVEDNGIGISPDTLARLFEPFSQADKSLARSSGGLGLSIVKGIVDLHEGDVGAVSGGLGKGSTFTICLPITPPDNRKAENPVPVSSAKNSKLLIIEDNRDFADILSAMLSELGYGVNVAYDGEEGVKLAKQIKPDVIFCDIGLPGMDGYEVAESIRNESEMKDTQLIALTGYAGASDVERVLKAGFNRHLAKPVDINAIKQLLNE